MGTKRFTETTQPSRVPAWVRCPRCEDRATLSGERGDQRVTCGACGFSIKGSWERQDPDTGAITLATQPAGKWRQKLYARWPPQRTEEFELWLQSPCCGGHVVWANNPEHLAFLKSFVSADHRERPSGPSGLAWRLPQWMKDSKNRSGVLKALESMNS